MSTSVIVAWATANPGQAALVFCCCWVLLFFARSMVHQLLLALASWVSRLLRHMAKLLLIWLDKINVRNREVLLNQALQLQEQLIEREFQRIAGIVNNDLSGYPRLQKAIASQISLIEEDYQKCGLEPEPSPEWVEALAVIVELKKAQEGHPALLKILTDIHESAVSLQKKSLGDYRDAIARKHQLLHAMMPHWRRLHNSVSGIGGKIRGLVEHAAIIDRYMQSYEEIRSQTDQIHRQLLSSVASRFIRDCLLMVSGLAGIGLNLLLISTHFGGVIKVTESTPFIYTPQFLAITLVLMQLSVSMVLLELLRVTNMFAGFGRLSETLRRRLTWAFIALLLGFAAVESSSMLIEPSNGEAAVEGILGIGGEYLPVGDSLLPVLPQMLLGFVLPLALTVVLIPFEGIIRDSRVIAGRLVEYFFVVMITVLRLMARYVAALLRLGIPLFDLLIFLPLWVDGFVREKTHEIKQKGAGKKEELPVAGGAFLRKD
ncbi:hypothetical protein [Gynuella sp.]|uniref:hypothetical protein n=1 Tax=Gynuella sp. TaxID=2969146 RepID=UPI003D0E1ECA